MRSVSFAVMGFDSRLAGIAGAPKSVVGLPFSRSTTSKLGAALGKSMRASFATFAYRGA